MNDCNIYNNKIQCIMLIIHHDRVCDAKKVKATKKLKIISIQNILKKLSCLRYKLNSRIPKNYFPNIFFNFV